MWKDAKILPGDPFLIINEKQFTLPKMMQQETTCLPI